MCGAFGLLLDGFNIQESLTYGKDVLLDYREPHYYLCASLASYV